MPEWAKDCEGVENSVRLVAVRESGKKLPMRVITLEHLARVRELNNTPSVVTDVQFLSQGMGFVLGMDGFTRFDLEACEDQKPNPNATSINPAALRPQ